MTMKNDKDIKKMLEEASNIEYDYDENEKSNKKGILLFSIFFTIIAVVMFAGSRVLKPQEFVDKTEAPDLNDGSGEIIMSEDTSEIAWGFKKPAEIPKWANEPFDKSMLKNDDFLSDIYNYAESFQGVSSAFGYKLSEEDGYTSSSKLSEVLNDDKSSTVPNEMYTYATKEDYYEAFSIYTQMLINPTFGGWAYALEPDNINQNNPFNKMSEMFTDEWWNQNIIEENSYRKLPIMYDWNLSGFDNEITVENDDIPIRSSFYGEVYDSIGTEERHINSKIIESDVIGNEKIGVNIPINYKAYNGDSKIEKELILYIEFTVNERSFSDENKVLISHAEII